jgi:hypothetical protein
VRQGIRRAKGTALSQKAPAVTVIMRLMVDHLPMGVLRSGLARLRGN